MSLVAPTNIAINQVKTQGNITFGSSKTPSRNENAPFTHCLNKEQSLSENRFGKNNASKPKQSPYPKRTALAPVKKVVSPTRRYKPVSENRAAPKVPEQNKQIDEIELALYASKQRAARKRQLMPPAIATIEGDFDGTADFPEDNVSEIQMLRDAVQKLQEGYSEQAQEIIELRCEIDRLRQLVSKFVAQPLAEQIPNGV